MWNQKLSEWKPVLKRFCLNGQKSEEKRKFNWKERRAGLFFIWIEVVRKKPQSLNSQTAYALIVISAIAYKNSTFIRWTPTVGWNLRNISNKKIEQNGFIKFGTDGSSLCNILM